MPVYVFQARKENDVPRVTPPVRECIDVVDVVALVTTSRPSKPDFSSFMGRPVASPAASVHEGPLVTPRSVNGSPALSRQRFPTVRDGIASWAFTTFIITVVDEDWGVVVADGDAVGVEIVDR